jgi:hypothetical protein
VLVRCQLHSFIEDTDPHFEEHNDELEKEEEKEDVKENEIFKGQKLINIYALNEFDVIYILTLFRLAILNLLILHCLPT